ncbi:hypothetical protein C1S82_07635 [Mycolicibacterium cosmeticum]|nr:hypothetical protein C1S82_07635 [Mycolicibacterium cosmeticum]
MSAKPRLGGGRYAGSVRLSKSRPGSVRLARGTGVNWPTLVRADRKREWVIRRQRHRSSTATGGRAARADLGRCRPRPPRRYPRRSPACRRLAPRARPAPSAQRRPRFRGRRDHRGAPRPGRRRATGGGDDRDLARRRCPAARGLRGAARPTGTGAPGSGLVTAGGSRHGAGAHPGAVAAAADGR